MLRLKKLIPRIAVLRRRHFDERPYTDVHLNFLGLFASVRVDYRGYSLHIDQRDTNRFVECFIDKPTGEISCRVSYKE